MLCPVAREASESQYNYYLFTEFFFNLNHRFFVEESPIIEIRRADLKCKHKLKSLCTSKFSLI
jgi:hypothetical protein